MLVGGGNKTSEVIKLTKEGIYKCADKPNAVIPRYGIIGGEVYGEHISCGGHINVAKRRVKFDDCYAFDANTDTFEKIDIVIPEPLSYCSSVVLSDGRWWVSGG